LEEGWENELKRGMAQRKKPGRMGAGKGLGAKPKDVGEKGGSKKNLGP